MPADAVTLMHILTTLSGFQSLRRFLKSTQKVGIENGRKREYLEGREWIRI